MRKILSLTFALFLLFSCKPDPEFKKDGKSYYTNSRCIKSHQETKYEYHYGYSFMKGKWCWHWGMNTNTICDEKVIDTILIK